MKINKWDWLPLDQRVTIYEAAEQLNIEERGLRTNYLRTNPPRKLPENITVLYERNKPMFLLRTH